MSAVKLLVVALLALLAACSSPPATPSGSDAGDTPNDGGIATWLDSSPATVGDDASSDGAADADAPTDAIAHVCTPAGSCGGSWDAFTCPSDFVPPLESHCSLKDPPDAGADASDTDGGAAVEWCCYGSWAP